MTDPKQNGLAPGQGQPVKSLYKTAAEIIAACARLACLGGALPLATVALLTQAVLMRLWGTT